MKRFSVRSVTFISKFAVFAPYSFSIYIFQIPVLNIVMSFVGNVWLASGKKNH